MAGIVATGILLLSCAGGTGTQALPIPPSSHDAITINASIPSGTTISSLNEIDVSYSRTVTGADDTAHYLPAGPGAASLAITGATLVSGNTYRLSTNGGITNGPLTITISGVTDENGIAVEGNVLYYLCDITNPTAVSDPPAGSRINSLEQARITFSKPVLNAWELTNYTISAPLTITGVDKIDDTTALLHFGGTVTDGDITLGMNTIKDSADRPLSGSSIHYTGDTTNPTMDAQPAPGTVLSSLSNIDISFSETVTGADDTDNYSFSGTGCGTLAVTTIAAVSGSLYRLSLSGTPGQGGFSLQLANIGDEAGNPPAETSIHYTADTAGPMATPDLPAFSTLAELSQIDITFSEQVIGANETASYTIHGSGAGSLQVDTVSKLSDTEFRILFNGDLSDGTFSIAMHNITDEQGNPLANDMIQFTADTTGPQATGFTPSDGAGAVPINSSAGITFNENIDCSTVSGDSLYGDHGMSGTIACSGNTATIVLSPLLLPGTTYTVTATADITDVYGNPLATPRTWTFTTTWTRQYGTTATDAYYSVDTDAAGNVYCVGRTNGAMDDQTLQGGYDIIITRINAFGQKVWTRQWGGTNNDYGFDVAVDATGHIYACGTYGTSTSSSNAVILKYNAAGDLIWQKTITGFATARAITIDSKGYLYITGETNNACTCQYLAKYDENGEDQWVEQPYDCGYYYINTTKIRLDSSGNIYISGYQATTYSQYNSSRYFAFINKFDSTGSYIIGRSFDSSLSDYGNSVGIGPSGEVYLVGTAGEAMPYCSSKGYSDYFLVKFNSSLSVSWIQQNGTAGYDTIYDCAIGPDGSVYLAGQTSANPNLALVKYSSLGFMLWTKNFGSGTDADIWGIRLGKDGFLYLVGNSRGSNDSNPVIGGIDGIVYKFDTNGNKY